MHNVYLFQPQYAVEIRKENTYWLPYSVGCIWGYANQFDDIKDNFKLVDLIFRREPIDELLARMNDTPPDVCGFSCYVWNQQYCLVAAREIKKRWPHCKIIFGGAQTSGRMIKHEFIDSIILAEGEENFLDILRNIIDGAPLQKFYQKQRLENLDIPSPYTTGVFDDIISKTKDAVWSMTFETNRGCPYSCTFCDWGGITYSKIKKFDLTKVKAELDWASQNPISYLFCADANFGIFKERDVEIAKLIRAAADRGRIDSVNMQYAKNSTEIVFTIAEILGNLSRGITVSVQSMNDETLKATKRKNLATNDIRKLMKLSDKFKIPTYTEVILGMPNETKESWFDGFSKILEMGQHQSIEMWFTQLLENSELAQFNSRQQYGLKTIIAKDYMPLYNKNDWRQLEEEIELVNSTNTMSTDDMIECYLYGWMIIHFHISGYSQVIAKYLHMAQNISYRTFYDQLFLDISTSDNFKEHFDQLRQLVTNYLYTGEIINIDGVNKGAFATKLSGHSIHAISFEWMYHQRNNAFDFIKSSAEKITTLPLWVLELQRAFIFDPNTQYPLTIRGDYDIINELDQLIEYNITSPLVIGNTNKDRWGITELTNPNEKTDIKFNFYVYRRKGLLKNLLLIS